MADNNPSEVQGGKDELRNNESAATQKNEQPTAQPLRPAMVVGIRSDADAKKDTDAGVSTKSAAPKGMSTCATSFLPLIFDAMPNAKGMSPSRPAEGSVVKMYRRNMANIHL